MGLPAVSVCWNERREARVGLVRASATGARQQSPCDYGDEHGLLGCCSFMAALGFAFEFGS
jgi:hypothetical protein